MDPAPSRARAYFERIRASGNGAKFLAELAVSETTTFESEFVDFKGGHDLIADGEKLKSLQELWAKNLSCFANSEGGVLIFGIHAPKGAANSVSLVQDVETLSGKLKNWLPVFTEPPVQGVEIDVYSDPGGPNKGFVVCFIPASPWRPHQVRNNGQPGPFYIRASDNCIPCSQSTLRALFAPNLIANLEVLYRVSIRSVDRDQRNHPVFVDAWLFNAGPATASEVFVRFRGPEGLPAPDIQKLMWGEAASGWPGQALLAKRSIHPKEVIPLFNAEIGRRDSAGKNLFWRPKFEFEFVVSARDQTPLHYGIAVISDDLKAGETIKAKILEKPSS